MVTKMTMADFCKGGGGAKKKNATLFTMNMNFTGINTNK